MDITHLKETLNKKNCDAYIIYDSAENSDMRYLSEFRASDPYIYICQQNGSEYLIVASMEELRATREARCPVISRTSTRFSQDIETGIPVDAAYAKMLKNCINSEKSNHPLRVMVPYSMPTGFANALNKEMEVIIDNSTVSQMRAIKSPEEITKIRQIQQENERGVHQIVEIIRKSDIGENMGLIYEDAPLTSEYLRKILHEIFYEHDLEDHDTIISCGEDTALPHAQGIGQLMAHQPIIMDVFPRGDNGYFADMTRTVSKGKPSDEICAMYHTVAKAKELARDMLKPGISGAEVHNRVNEYFKSCGYETAGTSGFIHSLGHGVGLAIHESPSLSPRGEILVPGNVITIEPGLYYPGTGGVRLEDMGVITDTGFDNFTIFEENLIIA